ncbi:hypothetical protein AB0K48_09455 [Nonomuraea sp. NPDC055795]
MPRLPKTVVAVLIATFLASITIACYMEVYYLELLQKHPIMVNLLSGVIGYSFLGGCVVVGINWYTDIHRSSRQEKAYCFVTGSMMGLLREVPEEFWMTASKVQLGRFTTAIDLRGDGHENLTSALRWHAQNRALPRKYMTAPREFYSRVESMLDACKSLERRAGIAGDRELGHALKRAKYCMDAAAPGDHTTMTYEKWTVNITSYMVEYVGLLLSRPQMDAIKAGVDERAYWRIYAWH